MDAFKDQLFEFPVRFLPSYPFEENSSSGKSYMKTRCPAWCDRVLLSVTAKQLISQVSIPSFPVSGSKIGWGCVGALSHWFQRETSMSCCECKKMCLKCQHFRITISLNYSKNLGKISFKIFSLKIDRLCMIIFLTFT